MVRRRPDLERPVVEGPAEGVRRDAVGMQHRKDDRGGQALGQGEVEVGGGLRVEGRGRLVEEQDVGLLQQHPREHQALLLPAGEHVAPGPALVQLLVELADEAAEPGPRQDLGDLERVEVRGRGAGRSRAPCSVRRSGRSASCAARNIRAPAATPTPPSP